MPLSALPAVPQHQHRLVRDLPLVRLACDAAPARERRVRVGFVDVGSCEPASRHVRKNWPARTSAVNGTREVMDLGCCHHDE